MSGRSPKRGRLEHHGTYPLPEGELDRFLASASLGYLSVADEAEVVTRQHYPHRVDSLQPVAVPAQILELQAAVRSVHVDPSLLTYAVEIVAATRERPAVTIGGSPRASTGRGRAGREL